MKIKHEKEIASVIDGAEGKEIVLVEEVTDISKIKKVIGTKNYIHYCYHDEKPVRECKREEI